MRSVVEVYLLLTQGYPDLQKNMLWVYIQKCLQHMLLGKKKDYSRIITQYSSITPLQLLRLSVL